MAVGSRATPPNGHERWARYNAAPDDGFEFGLTALLNGLDQHRARAAQ